MEQAQPPFNAYRTATAPSSDGVVALPRPATVYENTGDSFPCRTPLKPPRSSEGLYTVAVSPLRQEPQKSDGHSPLGAQGVDATYVEGSQLPETLTAPLILESPFSSTDRSAPPTCPTALSAHTTSARSWRAGSAHRWGAGGAASRPSSGRSYAAASLPVRLSKVASTKAKKAPPIARPAYRSRSASVLALQQRQMHRFVSRRSAGETLLASEDRPSEVSRDPPLAPAQRGGTVPITSAVLLHPFTATPRMRSVANKALYVRPRSDSASLSSSSSDSLQGSDNEASEGEPVCDDAVERSADPQGCSSQELVARSSPAPPGARRRRPMTSPRPFHNLTVTDVGVFLLDASSQTHLAPSQRRGSVLHWTSTVVAPIEPNSAPLTPLGCRSNEGSLGFADAGEAPTANGEEELMGLPLTPSAAEGASGGEVGHAAGEWNLPRIQQRIVAARAQAEVYQCFTRAMEILLAVQMSLDVDCGESNAGSERGGRPAMRLTPMQRAYYADLVGREMQRVTALWMTKLKPGEPRLATALSPLPPSDTTEGQPLNRSSNSSHRTSRRASVSSSCTASAGSRHASVPHRTASPSQSSEECLRNDAQGPRSGTSWLHAPPRKSLRADPVTRQARAVPRPTHAPAEGNATAAPLSPSHTQIFGGVSTHSSNGAVSCASDANVDAGDAAHLRSPLISMHEDSSFHAFPVFSTVPRSLKAIIARPPTKAPLRKHSKTAGPNRRKKNGRAPIRRPNCKVDVIDMDSDAPRELSSRWDDSALGLFPHSPFEPDYTNRSHRSTAAEMSTHHTALAMPPTAFYYRSGAVVYSPQERRLSLLYGIPSDGPSMRRRRRIPARHRCASSDMIYRIDWQPGSQHYTCLKATRSDVPHPRASHVAVPNYQRNQGDHSAQERQRSPPPSTPSGESLLNATDAERRQPEADGYQHQDFNSAAARVSSPTNSSKPSEHDQRTPSQSAPSKRQVHEATTILSSTEERSTTQSANKKGIVARSAFPSRNSSPSPSPDGRTSPFMERRTSPPRPPGDGGDDALRPTTHRLRAIFENSPTRSPAPESDSDNSDGVVLSSDSSRSLSGSSSTSGSDTKLGLDAEAKPPIQGEAIPSLTLLPPPSSEEDHRQGAPQPSHDCMLCNAPQKPATLSHKGASSNNYFPSPFGIVDGGVVRRTGPPPPPRRPTSASPGGRPPCGPRPHSLYASPRGLAQPDKPAAQSARPPLPPPAATPHHSFTMKDKAIFRGALSTTTASPREQAAKASRHLNNSRPVGPFHQVSHPASSSPSTPSTESPPSASVSFTRTASGVRHSLHGSSTITFVYAYRKIIDSDGNPCRRITLNRPHTLQCPVHSRHKDNDTIANSDLQSPNGSTHPTQQPPSHNSAASSTDVLHALSSADNIEPAKETTTLPPTTTTGSTTPVTNSAIPQPEHPTCRPHTTPHPADTTNENQEPTPPDRPTSGTTPHHRATPPTVHLTDPQTDDAATHTPQHPMPPPSPIMAHVSEDQQVEPT
ncbi:hypothetical protein ABL78_7331, partial [Leptomonas seymouri]